MAEMIATAQEWIDKLGLQPHPEGGYFRETYRSSMLIKATTRPTPVKNASTVIYYLLPGSEFSSFHRLRSDECWYFHAGSSLELAVLDTAGMASVQILGIQENEQPHLVVPAEHWFGAKPIDSGSYTLVSCSVAPGFSFEDFEMGDREALSQKYPKYRSLIERYTHG